MDASEKELFFSLEKGYDLYHYLLLLMVELTDLQRKRLDTAKAKYMPTEEELNPNTKFVDNKFIEALRNDPKFYSYVTEQKLSWVNESDLLRILLDEIVASELYTEYMSTQDNSFAADKEFWRAIFKNIIMNSRLLDEILEDQSLYWNDDIDIVGTVVLKTIKKFSENAEETAILPKFKDEADSEFARTLFRKSLIKSEEYQKMISDSAKNWELDRIAFMDIVIMIVALAEVESFPSIPVKVTLNEFIEIAKSYSTQKSGRFVNGILDVIVSNLKKEGRINKD